MSALAKLLWKQGNQVAGSDAVASANTEELSALGISVVSSNGILCSLTTVFAKILNAELTDRPISSQNASNACFAECRDMVPVNCDTYGTGLHTEMDSQLLKVLILSIPRKPQVKG